MESQPVAMPKAQAGQQQISGRSKDCGSSIIPDSSKLPKYKVVTKLIEFAKFQFEMKHFECAVQALEQANVVVVSVDDGVDRAAMGFEIKDAVLPIIKLAKIPDTNHEKRLIAAAVQSVDSNGILIKTASEDERFNDAAFFGWVAHEYDGYKLDDYRQTNFIMFRLNYSLPDSRRWAYQGSFPLFLSRLISNGKTVFWEVAELWKITPDDVRQENEIDLVDKLYKHAAQHTSSYRLLSEEEAKRELDGISRLSSMLKETSWDLHMYGYVAEAYWQSGDREKARENFNKARALAKYNGDLYLLARSLCKSKRCPYGIYDSGEMSILLDEEDKKGSGWSDRIQAIRKTLSRGNMQ